MHVYVLPCYVLSIEAFRTIPTHGMAIAVIGEQGVAMALIPDTSYTVVKTGFDKAFHYAPLRAIIKQAIDFATPLRIQGQLLATFHVVRLVENSIPIPRLDTTSGSSATQPSVTLQVSMRSSLTQRPILCWLPV